MIGICGLNFEDYLYMAGILSPINGSQTKQTLDRHDGSTKALEFYSKPAEACQWYCETTPTQVHQGT